MADRRYVLSGVAAAVFSSAAHAAPRRARVPKVSKTRAQYQDHPMDIRSCATCAQFVAPGGCKVVIGKVSPDGWCALYDLAD